MFRKLIAVMLACCAAAWAQEPAVSLYPGQMATLTVTGPLAMRIAGHQTAQASGASTATTAGMDTSAANTIVLVIGDAAGHDPSTDTVSDSESNTWTVDYSYHDTSGSPVFPSLLIEHCDSCTTGASHTFSASGSNAVIGAYALEYAKASSSFDNYFYDANGPTSTGPGNFDFQFLPVSLGQSNEFLLFAFSHLQTGGNVSIDPNPGATLLDDVLSGTNLTGLTVLFAPATDANLPAVHFTRDGSGASAGTAVGYKAHNTGSNGNVDAVSGSFTWSSADTSVATVAATPGTNTMTADVTGVANGDITITATGTRDSSAGSIIAKFEVKVISRTSTTFNGSGVVSNVRDPQ